MPAPLPTSEKLPQSFRLFLQSEFRRRRRVNPSYSLRAFARFLGLESSRLSKILHGKRPASAKLIPELGHRLGLRQEQIFHFLAKSKDRPSYQQLSLDLFQTIEDWRHYALLELMKLETFRPHPSWIAKVLQVSLPEVREYIERLERVGLLSTRPEWSDLSAGFSTHIISEQETTQAHRRTQKEILALAAHALDEVPMEMRDQSSMMMATSHKKLKEAKKRITKFRRELCDFLEDTDQKDSVYQLSISLFPLVQDSRGKK